MRAERNIVHPCRILVTGRSGGGKTTAVVDLIDRVFRHQVDRVVVCCPSWTSQKLFDPIRNLVKGKRDILDYNPKNGRDPFDGFFRSLTKQKEYAALNGEEMLKTLLFIDDMGGDEFQHKTFGYLSRISVQSRNFSLSIINISQQPKLACPSLRQAIDAAIIFPPTSTNGTKWCHEELNLNLIPKKEFDFMITSAWRGGRDDIKELGSHFLFVVIPQRKPARYYIDYTHEITWDDSELVEQEPIRPKRKRESDSEEESNKKRKL